MTTFNQATELLHKRCDYIEDRLAHHSALVSKPAAGKHYRHFILQGLVHAAFYTAVSAGLRSLSSTGANSYACRVSDMHLDELGVFETEAVLTDHTVNVQTLRDYGLDISNYPSASGLGQVFRRGDLYTPIVEAYDATFGRPSGYVPIEHITAHYKGRELTPVDPEAGWAAQAENLVYQAQSQPLKSLLDPQHIVAPDGNAGAFSLRRAGFPATQFQDQIDGHNISPVSVYSDLGDEARPLEEMTYPTAVRHCPSLVMVTIECPDNLDELIAGGSTDDVQLTYYFKHIMVPHWVGLASIFDHANSAEGEEGKPLAQSRLYDPALVSTFADGLTSASIRDPRNDNGNAYGDLVIYSPSDSSLAKTETLHLRDARGFVQELQQVNRVGLHDKSSYVVSNADYRPNGVYDSMLFINDPSKFVRNYNSNVAVSLKTTEPLSVRGLVLANENSDSYWGRLVRVYTKPLDYSNVGSDSGWTLHESVSIDPQQDEFLVMLSNPTPETNVFRVSLTSSKTGRFVSAQYIDFVV